MSSGDNQIYPNSNTYNGESMLQAAFDDLLTTGIDSNINLNGFIIQNSGIAILPTDVPNYSQISGGLPTTSSLNYISSHNPTTGTISM